MTIARDVRARRAEREAIAKWLESCVHRQGYTIHASWLQEAGRELATRIRKAEHHEDYPRDPFFE